MDSSNLHHQVEDHQLMVGSSSNPLPSLSSPSFSVEDNDHAWSRATPTFFLNNNDNIHAACDEATPNTLNNPIVQEVDFPWPNDRISINQSSPHQEHHHHLHQQRIIAEKIKEEQSPSSTSSDHHHHTNNSTFAKFSDLLSSSSTTTSSEMLLLKNTLLSPTYKNHMFSNNTNVHQPPSLLFQPSIQYQQNNNNNNTINKGISTTFSQIFPSVNISNMIMSNNNNNNISTSPLLSSSSSKIDDNSNNNNNNSNVEGGFDLFATERLLSGESLNHSSPSNNLLELFEGSPRFSVDHDLQQSNNDLKLCKIAHNNISSFNNNGVPAESKNYIMEQKSDHHQTASKKQRSESRASCPPFKVRKEKLGDRIAALQQLVAPFGKTDTASVLMEAIGYIKFLQNQVETLSVPYMKLASRNKNSNTPRVTNDEYCGSDEPKLTDDLRSRGLCLVPLSCTTYINLASDATSNGGIWPPTNFNPAPGF